MLASGAVPSLAERIARKAFRPLYRPYYLLLWSRRFPGAAAIERLVRRFEESSRRADVPLAGDEWDAQYAGGEWDFLADPDEVERFRAVAGLIERHAPGDEVLDVGCGEGLLPGYLEPGRRYLGIDLSREAIARAEARLADPAAGAGASPAAFEVADAESWQPGRRFAAVVLNECLYYFRRPLDGARRYLDAVEPGGGTPGAATPGVMIVSMFRGPRADAIGRRLAAELAVAEEIEVARGAKRWRIAVFRAPVAAAPAAATAPPPAP
jgi:SAM-dependent methyltransferase